MDRNNYADLQEKIGYTFAEPDLLRAALTHSSYVNEKGLKRIESNERLEFLGDSLLGMIVALLIFKHTPILTEGEMSKLRAELVCEQSLCKLAHDIDLGSYLLLGKGEDNGGGRTRPSILSDAFEAVVASVYLDGGIEPTVEFITRTFKPHINSPAKGSTDYKSILQEHIQNKPKMSHSYNLISQAGPDHNKTFTVEVVVNGETMGVGKGKSKKSAEQAAASAALNALKMGE